MAPFIELLKTGLSGSGAVVRDEWANDKNCYRAKAKKEDKK